MPILTNGDRSNSEDKMVHWGPGVMSKGMSPDLATKSGLDLLIVGTKPSHEERLSNLAQNNGIVLQLVTKGLDLKLKAVQIGGAFSPYTTPSDRFALLDILAARNNNSPVAKALTVGVTTGGYPLKDGKLDVSNQDIANDIEALKQGKPEAVAHFLPCITHALWGQWQDKVEHPSMVIAMENWPDGSTKLRELVLELADCAYGGEPGIRKFKKWLRTKVPFPCVMIDRIVPGVKGQGKVLLEAFTDSDACGVVVESYWEVAAGWDSAWGSKPTLWGKPAKSLPFNWVEPKLLKLIEHRKHYFVNGGHFGVATLGLAKGWGYIDDPMNTLLPLSTVDAPLPIGCKLLSKLHRDYLDAAQFPAQFAQKEWKAYSCAVRERFKNGNLNDGVDRVARRPAEKMERFMVTPLLTILRAKLSAPVSLVVSTGIAIFGLGSCHAEKLFEGEEHLALCSTCKALLYAKNAKYFCNLVKGNPTLEPLAAHPGILQHLHKIVKDIQGNKVRVEDLVANL